MKISWQVDESLSSDPNGDPVVDVLLIEENSSIIEVNAYLDSWLEALVAGLVKLNEHSEVVLDLIEEPDPLILRSSGEKIQISYKNQILSTTRNEFRSALSNAVARFIEEIGDSRRDATSKHLLDFLQTFLGRNEAI